MKKSIALLLALAMIVCLFAACGGGSTGTDTPATDSNTTGNSDTTGGDSSGGGAAAETGGTYYNWAVNDDGSYKYDVDDKGYPLGYYEYELPITNSNEVLVYWDPTIMPFFVVNSEGANGPYQTMLRETTGVNIEYQAVDYASASQAFSVMMATSDFTDIMGGVATPGYGFWATNGGGTTSDMIDQKYFANIADYRGYAPNFLYQIPRFDYDPELINMMWINDTMVVNMGPFVENVLPGTGMVIRGDWLDQLDGAPKSTEIVTYDQVHEVLTRIKNEIDLPEDGYPIFFFASVEAANGMFFGGYQTGLYSAAPAVKVVDGQVQFTLTEDVDYETLNLFLTWLDEGLVDPAFSEYATTDAAQAKFYGNGYGMTPANPTEIGGWEKFNTVTTEARYDPMHTPKLAAGDENLYGKAEGRYAYIGGGWSFSATGKNIPLAITYTDWFYSEEGSFLGSYGVEGDSYDSPNATFYYTDDGTVMKTDFVINNSDSLAIGWFMMSYQQVSFSEPVRHVHLGNYSVEGGQRFIDMFYVWEDDYHDPDASGHYYDWPSTSATATEEQQRELNTFLTDANTWFSEEYAQFLNGSRPLTKDTWSTYVSGLMDAGYTRYQTIMQTVYDDYMDKRAEQLG